MRFHLTPPGLALLCAAGPSWAQVPVQKPGLVPVPNEAPRALITCWYNRDGQYTGADTAERGVVAGKPVKTGRDGDYYWAYTLQAADGRACPRKLPA